MEPVGSCLGVCYTGNQIFFSVNQPQRKGHLLRIGSVEFNFNIREAIISGSSSGFPALRKSLQEIKSEYNCNHVKVLAPATEECWTVVPRSVYEDTTERETHIQLLMNGIDRSQIQITWHTISNSDSRLLLLRKQDSMNGFSELLTSFRSSEYVSEFELGVEWQLHMTAKSSCLFVHCAPDYISMSSFILGKLRGCTFFEYDQISDLPYLWNLYAGRLGWLQGIHDENIVFGSHAREASEHLQAYWFDHGNIRYPDSLAAMQVSAAEKTYGFPLESAFPAILMSLNLERSGS
ncbi:MAG: hypothetical protein EA360_02605 [Balneolaceae bacterium]|nr:MAG: hypothetical protein EA360_02605 [Balneolaceae bacterium]